MDRGLVLRCQLNHTQNPLSLVRRVSARVEDFVLVVDAGWSTDLLQNELWASEFLNLVNELNPADNQQHIELVVAGSSFPESFSKIGSRGEIQAQERILYNELVGRFNRLDVKYGDWASGRPSFDPKPMTPVPRIDFPLSREWVCFRKVEDEEYADIARRVVSDASWSDALNIWGTYTIEATANDLPGMIRSPHTATAVRMNIHMFRQASYDATEFTGDSDEPFVDE
ncbi:hypothetical protein HY29_18320 [Hyphomonas beringensis]|uniref:Uncharacterized protein n=2 Tax=Hyphomonas beringensis TaxID=1280946 RepID=A0A062U223_9PROT|nr:hypothetical protein HY29_18320 [Hyphomonas beringensis]